jgi:IBR domain, a half RING-finger domain
MLLIVACPSGHCPIILEWYHCSAEDGSPISSNLSPPANLVAVFLLASTSCLESSPSFPTYFSFFLLLSLSNCQQFINFTAIDPNQCIAPSGYLNCYERVVENTAKCMNETAGNPTAQKGCACVDGEEKINCFAQACWNRVRFLSLFHQLSVYSDERGTVNKGNSYTAANTKPKSRATSPCAVSQQKKIELDTPDRTYSSNPLCSVFIRLKDIMDEQASCADCGTVTCTLCKATSHGGGLPC